MDGDELNSLLADTRVALAGGGTAEELSTALVSLLRTARDDGDLEQIEQSMLRILEILAPADSDTSILEATAMDLMPEMTMCATLSEPCAQHFESMLLLVVEHNSAREGMSMSLEAAQLLASCDWDHGRSASLAILSAIPRLLARIPRRRDRFLRGAADAGVMLMTPLGDALKASYLRAAVPKMAQEMEMRAIPAPTPVEVSYAAMQKQKLILRRSLPSDVESSDAAPQGEQAYSRPDISSTAGYDDDRTHFADFAHGLANAALAEDDANSTTDRAAAATLLRGLVARLLGSDAAMETGEGCHHSRDRRPSGPPHLPDNAAFAAPLLSLLPRLGVERLSCAVEPVPLFGRSWGVVDSDDDDDDEGSDDDEGREEAALLQACLLYWIFWLPQQMKPASTSGGEDVVPSVGDLAWTCSIAGPSSREEGGAAVEAVADAYLTIMQEATSRQSIALAIKSLSLAAGIGKIVAVADVHNGDIVPEKVIEDSPGNADATLNPVLPPVRVLESVVMSMAFHPVRSIREEAHKTLKVLLSAIPSRFRLEIYKDLLESAEPAAAAMILQQLQHDFISASSNGIQQGCGGASAVFTSDAVFAQIRDWIDPNGAHGWRHSLGEFMEPLGAALSILRFMLISKRWPGQLSSASTEAAGASDHEGAAPSSQGKSTEPSQGGGSCMDTGILDSWLELLLKACSALSSELNQEQQATSVSGLPPPDGIIAQGASAANESRLAMLLGLDRVTEAVQWCRDALQPRQK